MKDKITMDQKIEWILTKPCSSMLRNRVKYKSYFDKKLKDYVI